MSKIARGIYRHNKKGKLYRVVDTVTHSETLEDLVVYESLYDNEFAKLWVRPLGMFTEEVVIDGKKQPRFSLITKTSGTGKVRCTTLMGETKEVDVEELSMRPAAYGLIEYNDSLLLVNTRSTGQLFFPGGEVERGESTREAVKREIWEETGIEVNVGELFTVHESFFFYDPWDKAFQNLSFIYRCTPRTMELSEAHNEARDEAETPQWMAIKDLSEDQFQDFAKGIFSDYVKSR